MLINGSGCLEEPKRVKFGTKFINKNACSQKMMMRRSDSGYLLCLGKVVGNLYVLFHGENHKRHKVARI